MGNYKEKYEQALNRAKVINPGTADYEVAVKIFPELKESEDERIWTINYLNNRKLNSSIIEEKESLKKAIAWLEKQGEQKSIDKVEPKFKVGDKITNGENIYTINNIVKDCYFVKEHDCVEIPFEYQDKWNLVEPKFKVGDIITNKKSKDTVKIVQILHDSYCYSGWDGAATVHSDFSISEQDNWELVWSEEDEPQKELAETYLAVFDKKFPILPTLEGKKLADYKNFLNKCQQILGLKYWSIRPLQAKLFEKLSLLWAAWGAEHLKGLGQTNEDTDNKNHAWSEEDEDVVDIAIRIIQNGGDDCAGILDSNKALRWLKSLKERVKPQTKQEWTGYDEKAYEIALLDIDKSPSITKNDTIDWLKSLKERMKGE